MAKKTGYVHLNMENLARVVKTPTLLRRDQVIGPRGWYFIHSH